MLSQYPDIEKVIIFGSRAMGNQKAGSDIDLALIGKLNFDTLRHLSVQLNQEIALPYQFDLLDESMISDQSLKDHIQQQGKLFYQKSLLI